MGSLVSSCLESGRHGLCPALTSSAIPVTSKLATYGRHGLCPAWTSSVIPVTNCYTMTYMDCLLFEPLQPYHWLQNLLPYDIHGLPPAWTSSPIPVTYTIRRMRFTSQCTAVRLQRLSWPFLPKPQQLTAASCLCCPRNVFTGGYSFHVSVLNTQCTLTLSDNCWSREERMDFLSTLNMPTLVERCITRQRWQVRLCIVAHLRHQ